MKKFLAVVGVLVALLVGGLFAVSRLVSVDNMQQQVIDKVREATGRELAFDRPRLSFFPTLSLRLKNVTLGNPGGKKPSGKPEDSMISLKELNLQLALQPLFHHQVEVTSFSLQKPVIHLRREKDGRTNWVFSGVKKAQQPAAADGGQADSAVAPHTGAKENSAKSAMRDIRDSGYGFKFGQMQIADGTITFDDAAKGTSLVLDNVNVTLNWPEFSSPLGLDGEFNYKSQRVNFVINLAKPLDYLAGGASDGDLQIKTKGFTAKAKGALSSQGILLDGTVDTSIDDLGALTAWLGATKRGLPFEKVSFVSVAKLSAEALKLTGAKLVLDDIKAGGDATVALSGRPNIEAQLTVDHLDLDRFSGLGKSAGDGAKGAGGSAAPSAKEASAGWSETPLNVAPLKMLDAEVKVVTQGFTVKGADVGPSTLTLSLHEGALKFATTEATMFGGTAQFGLNVNAAARTPGVMLKAKFVSVGAKPLLTAFAGFTKLSGAASGDVDVVSEGGNKKELIGNLAGRGAFDFKNGALEGVDLMKIMKLIQAHLTDAQEGGQTQFVDLAGTYTVKNGVAHNDDLKMTGPLLQATGAGDVDLPRRYVDYRALPKLTTSSAEDAKGLTVPVDIKGPFGAVKAKPDYKGLVAGLLGVPAGGDAGAAAKAQGNKILGGIRKNPGKLLQGLFGGGKSSDEGQ